MAACKPARQCTLIFPSGKRCGSLALRDQPYCYYHAANHRAFARDRFLGERLGRIREKLDTMPVSDLLNFLHQKLCTLPRTLTRFPEIDFTLTYTLDRIAELTSLESAISSFLQQNQQFTPQTHAKSSEVTNLAITP